MIDEVRGVRCRSWLSIPELMIKPNRRNDER